MQNTTTKTFRAYARIEEAMLRAAMPRTAERDDEHLDYYRNTARTARTLTLTAKLAEVAHA